jgi:hypothetical protein
MNVTKILLTLTCVLCPAAVWAHSVNPPTVERMGSTAERASWAAERIGPPAICFALEIGEQQSLPWGDGAFTRPVGYAVQNLAADVIQILDSSAETVVHMETLRRAAIWMGMGAPKEAKMKQRMESVIAGQREQLLAALRARALDEFIKLPVDQAPHGRPLGMALFDLGFFLGALGQINGGLGVDGGAELTRATQLCSKDGNLWLGFCLAGFVRNGHQFPADALQRVCHFAEQDSALRANLVATVGVVAGHSSYDEIVAWANQRSVKNQ